jgi:hypothetical protein
LRIFAIALFERFLQAPQFLSFHAGSIPRLRPMRLIRRAGAGASSARASGPSAPRVISSLTLCTQHQSTRYRTQVSFRGRYCVAPRARNRVAPAHAVVSRERTLLDPRTDKAFALETIQRRINRSRRYLAMRRSE